MKLCDVDEDNSLLSMTQSQDGIPPPDPLRVDWPKVFLVYSYFSLQSLNPVFIFVLVKDSFMTSSLFQDRVLINRLDSLCTLVLSGQWPSGRRYVTEAQLNPNPELVGDEMAYTRVIRKPALMSGGPGAEGEDGEFTVKLLKVRIRLIQWYKSEKF